MGVKSEVHVGENLFNEKECSRSRCSEQIVRFLCMPDQSKGEVGKKQFTILDSFVPFDQWNLVVLRCVSRSELLLGFQQCNLLLEMCFALQGVGRICYISLMLKPVPTRVAECVEIVSHSAQSVSRMDPDSTLRIHFSTIALQDCAEVCRWNFVLNGMGMGRWLLLL